LREPSTDLRVRSTFQALADGRDLRVGNSESLQGFREGLNLESPGYKRNSLLHRLRLYWMGNQPIGAGSFCPCADYIGPVLVLAEPVDQYGPSVRKYRLNLKGSTQSMNVVPQRAEVHVRALLDARDRTLWHVQHLRHIRLRQSLCATEFIEGHPLQFIAHALLVVGADRGVHLFLKLFIVPRHGSLPSLKFSQVPVVNCIGVAKDRAGSPSR
jgi:hypothetical protein